MCVCVCARFEGETAVLNASVYRVPGCTALGKLMFTECPDLRHSVNRSMAAHCGRQVGRG